MRKLRRSRLGQSLGGNPRTGPSARVSRTAPRPLGRCVVVPVLALATVLVTGCRPRLESLRAAPRLTFEELEKGKVAVLPLSAKVNEVTPRDLERMDAIYTYAFDQHAHGMPRVPSKMVASVLGSTAAHWDTVVRFADTQRVDYEALASLGYAIGARYLVFGRVEYAEVFDTTQPFTQWIDAKTNSVRHTCGPASEVPRGKQLSIIRVKPHADFSAYNCSTSQAVGFVTVVDIRTGTAPWIAKHQISRNVGDSIYDSNPAPLVWALFSDIFERMPERN